MLPISIMICLLLGIFSLNYYKLLYKIDFADFYAFFHELQFPLSIYHKWHGLYIYVEKINQSDNLNSIRIIRMVLGAAMIVILLANLSLFTRSTTSQQIIVFALFVIKALLFLYAWRLGQGLKQIK